MPIQTFTPPVAPSPGTAHKPQFDILEASFGAGYSMPTPRGCNHIRRVVSLKWDVLTEPQMRNIIDFFYARGGTEPFYYRPHGETEVRKWTCADPTYTTTDGIWQVTATLTESFTNRS